MKNYAKYIFLIATSFVFVACKHQASSQTVTPTPPPASSFFAKGADISWLTEMENNGYKFYDSTGKQADCIALLQSLGMNTIRLRAWVNPTDGWCNTSDLIKKAIRANAAGMHIMIDLHYSDVWADPGHQTKPTAWLNQDISTLQTSLYNYTVDVMTQLKANNVAPDWVQVGNETNDGMLWEDGRASTNMKNFSLLINKGYDAVKSVFANAKVIVHISNGYDNSLFRWMFDGLTNNNVKYDIIGMSLYPDATNWQTLNAQCLNNVNDMISRYNKPVMICEVGMSYTAASTCQSFLSDLISKMKSVTNNNGLGVLYWEPECYNNWKGYSLGAFDNTGKPTAALNAFKN